MGLNGVKIGRFGMYLAPRSWVFRTQPRTSACGIIVLQSFAPTRRQVERTNNAKSWCNCSNVTTAHPAFLSAQQWVWGLHIEVSLYLFKGRNSSI